MNDATPAIVRSTLGDDGFPCDGSHLWPFGFSNLVHSEVNVLILSPQPITRSEHASKSWCRPNGYHFAATTTSAHLAAPEIAKAATAYALAFVQSEGRFSLVAVLGLLPDQNLFVDETGAWTGSYIPAALRAYPFCLTWTAQDGGVLSVDVAGGLVQEDGSGEPFFDEAGNLSEAIRQIFEFLRQVAEGQEVLGNACTLLQQQGILEPWPLTIDDGTGARPIAGLYRVSEGVLNALPAEGLITLHRAGVLSLAYAQLVSMSNLAVVGERAQARAQAEAAARALATSPPLITLPESNTIDWDWSKIGA